MCWTLESRGQQLRLSTPAEGCVHWSVFISPPNWLLAPPVGSPVRRPGLAVRHRSCIVWDERRDPWKHVNWAELRKQTRGCECCTTQTKQRHIERRSCRTWWQCRSWTQEVWQHIALVRCPPQCRCCCSGLKKWSKGCVYGRSECSYSSDAAPWCHITTARWCSQQRYCTRIDF